MKLEKLNEPLRTYKGEMIKDGQNGIVTMADALASCLGSTQSKDGRDRIFSYKLGVKLSEGKEELDIDVRDFDLLKKAVESGGQWTDIVLGQLGEYLNEVEARHQEKEDEEANAHQEPVPEEGG